MTNQAGKVRVNFELDCDVSRRMHQALQWGTKGPCLAILAEKLVEAVERDGMVMVGAILDGRFELRPLGNGAHTARTAHSARGRKHK